MKSLAVITFLLFIVSCGPTPMQRYNTSNPSINSQSKQTQLCNCPFENAPVCSNNKTYYSACVASCAGVSYSDGACANNNCDISSGPVCGQPPMATCDPGLYCTQQMPNPKQYQNECDMKNERSSLIKFGQCFN